MARSFFQLNIWQKGYQLLMEVYRITAKFPVEEKYNLTSQIKRAANAVIANIAESHGRYYFADKIRVLYTARGEIEELRNHLKVAEGLGYIDQETFVRLDKEYSGLARGISRYISSLNQQKTNPLIH